jgi:sugar phosphate isomerase/epimerase
MRNEREWTRREWLQAAAAAPMVAAAGSSLRAAGGTRPWGVQIYTVRDQLKTQAAAAFKAIADIGYKEVEMLSERLAESATLAKAVGLNPVSLHIPSPIVTGDWAPWAPALKAGGGTPPPPSYNLDAVVSEAKAIGIKYLVVSYLMPNERSQAGFFPRFIDAMNAAGEKVKQAGLQLCYHNHGFEFEKGADGAVVLDTMMARFDRALVKLELDVFWVSVAGSDPVALLQKHAGRVALVHLKDKAAGVPVVTDESKVAPTTFKEIGSGSLDFRAILKAADAAGVEHYFVEQDQTPGDPVASLKKSFAYLQQIA